MNPLIKKFLQFSMGPVVGALIAFITVPLTTYFISPEEFGKASMFVLIQTLISTIIFLGLDQSFTREFNDTHKKRELLQNAILLPLILSFIILILIILNVNFVSYLLFGEPTYILATLLFGITIIFQVIERFLLLAIRMEEKAIEFSIVNIIIKLAILVFILVIVLNFRQDFLAVVYATVFGQVFADIYLIIRYKSYLNFFKLNLNIKLLKGMLKFGLPLILAASLVSLLNSFDRLALRTWSDFYEIGVFTAALKIASVLTIVQASFTNFWVPVAYKWYKDNKEIRYYQLVSDSILLLMSILFCLITIFKDFIIMLLSAEYFEARYLIALLCLQPILYTLSETTTLGIAFSKKSYLNLIISIISITPNIILNIILVKNYGATGAAIATSVSFIFFFIARSFFSNKNWVGIKYSHHMLVITIMFILALVNTSNYNWIYIFNFLFLFLLIFIQFKTVSKIFGIYNKKDKQIWIFN